jgi:hypothetical protein
MEPKLTNQKPARPIVPSTSARGPSPQQTETADIDRAEGEGMHPAARRGESPMDPALEREVWERLRRVFWPHAEG